MPQTVHILIADDDEEDHMILEQLLHATSDQVPNLHFAIDGFEVLSSLNNMITSGTPPDLIVLDVNMPRLNGREALIEIRKIPDACTIPIVMFSTSFNEKIRNEFLELGATEYVVKPSDHQAGLDIGLYFQQLARTHV